MHKSDWYLYLDGSGSTTWYRYDCSVECLQFIPEENVYVIVFYRVQMGSTLVLLEEGPWARVPFSGTESDMREEELEVALKVSTTSSTVFSYN